MSTIAARTRARAVTTAGVAERVLPLLPLLTIYVWLCFLYAWESWGHVAPWLNGDELEMAQLSRAVAETGETGRRGVPIGAESIYPYVLAPVWWIDDIHTAYAAAKYLGVTIMAASLFPAYALARLVVGKPAALFVAAATASIPALYYSSMLVEEPLAYTYSTLCAFLVAKALASRTRGWFAVAVPAALFAPLVRGELAVVPVAFLLAGLWLLATSERARRSRVGWTRWDWVGALVLLAGVVIVANASVSSFSYSWRIATIFWKGRMIERGFEAAGALTIGLGVLPVVVGLAALLWPAQERRHELRAVVATALALVAGYAWYTAIKGAYISTTFSTLTVERNLFYVAPLLFLGTALFFERPRLRPWAVAATAALALTTLLTTKYQMDLQLYSDAPGLAILQAANRNFAWTPERAQNVLLGLLVLSLLVVVLPRLLPWARSVPAVLGAVAVGVVAWNVTGQVSAASASNRLAEEAIQNIQPPLDWLDRASGGEPVLYLGQKIADPNGVWQLEFWNRSLRHVWSTDGTAPGPGPTLTPDLVNPRTGAITPAGVRYVVTDPGIELVARPVASHLHTAAGAEVPWRLVEIVPPLRLQNDVRGVYSDFWMGRRAGYSQFTTPGGRAGYAVVEVSRLGWGGKDEPGKVRIGVGAVAVGADKQPMLGKMSDECRFTINRLERRVFLLRTPPPPFHVAIDITPTFNPRELDPRYGDIRELGAQVKFSFVPERLAPPERRGCAAGLRGPGR